MHIDLRQLRHFVALIEHRSFVAAADAVNLSQSAFSRSIQALEHSAGYQLVDRASKELPPTKQGLVVLEHARRLLRNAHDLSLEIDRFNGEESGELLFGCGPAPAAQLIPRAIARFIGDYPKAHVRFLVDNWQELDKRLTNEEIEFFVADTRHFEANPDYRIIRLRPQKWYFCCRSGHPLAAVEDVSCEQVFSYPLATTFRPPNIRKVLMDYSRRRDFTPAVECEHGHALLNVVRHSDAIGIANPINLEEYLLKDELKILQVHDLPEHLEELNTRYGIVSRVSRSLSPLARAMAEQIERSDAQLADQLAGLSLSRLGI
ncbi:LysR family transcriptional regulator [Pseudomonas sp. ABC1]|uniref:LysR family transcriptional regulator n=1 Tax=Pseudomonas sp. ABC1 TaxID=2748080 RepID=UPI0015C36599|nr:LysR family transcriptional regulator [Pseudomonas sp. ABC1]QLF94432.1 LysR family transcriptional regulator [Pseudomonas sp. ABC1]